MNRLDLFTDLDWQQHDGLRDEDRWGELSDVEHPMLISRGSYPVEVIVCKAGLFVRFLGQGSTYEIDTDYRTAAIIATLLPLNISVTRFLEIFGGKAEFVYP